ncbi:MAG: type II secretion system protein N [Allosphingosinicella sp.]
MRLAFDSRRLIGRARGVSGWTALEAALLALIAIQCARLVWTIVTPVGPVGEWSAGGGAPPASSEALTGFDPFFRLTGGGGPATITSLNLKLFGIRQDQASGRGSAIIATSDGQQKSFAVGDEIEPGVILKAVAFDNVTISRGGADEQLFMDQSQGPQTTAVPAAPPAPAPPPLVRPISSAPPLPAATNPLQVSAQPRMNGQQLTGVIVQPRGNGDGFRAAGLAPGDVVTAVNGVRITSPDQVQSLAAELASPRVTLQVERNGRMVVLRPGDRR